jgi:hypothetical protein
MVTEDALNRFVRLLADWAADPDDRQLKQALLEPRHDEIRQWLRTIAGAYYWDKFNRRGGLPREEFEEECIYRLFLWLKRHQDEVKQAALTIDSLEGLLRRIAMNYCYSLGRRLRRRWFHSLDEFDDETGEEATLRRVPEGLQVAPLDPAAVRYPGLESEFRLAQQLVPEFIRSLAGQEKTLELLGALSILGGALGKLHGFPQDWLVFRILKRPRGRQMPKMVRKFLQVKFPTLDLSVLDGRLNYLRRAFLAFLMRRRR